MAEAFNLTNRRNDLTRNTNFGSGAYPGNPLADVRPDHGGRRSRVGAVRVASEVLMRATAARIGVVAVACVMAVSCGGPPAPAAVAHGAIPGGAGTVLGGAGPSGPAISATLAVPGTLNRMPSLAVSGNRVAAVWTSTLNDVMDVYAAVSEDGGATFSGPRRVNHLPGDARSNAEQPPRVVMSGSAITVIWPSRPDGASAIRMSRSSDGGRTFSPAVTLHDSSITGARGWQSLAAGRDGAVHAAWLDGRDAEPMPASKPSSSPSAGGHAGHGGGGAHQGAPRQDVYQAVILPDGRIDRGARDPRRLFLLQDGGRGRAERARQRRLAPHLPRKHARYCHGDFRRRRSHVRAARARERG